MCHPELYSSTLPDALALHNHFFTLAQLIIHHDSAAPLLVYPRPEAPIFSVRKNSALHLPCYGIPRTNSPAQLFSVDDAFFTWRHSARGWNEGSTEPTLTFYQTDEINTRATYSRNTAYCHRALLGTNAATRLAVRTGAAAGKAEDIGLGPFGAPKIHTRVNNGRRNWKASWKGAADERERERESLRRVTTGKLGREPNPALASVSGSRKEHRM